MLCEGQEEMVRKIRAILGAIYMYICIYIDKNGH